MLYFGEPVAVLDPDLEKRGGLGHRNPYIRRGPVLPPKFFWPFRPQLGPKIRVEGAGPLGPSPGSATE